MREFSFRAVLLGVLIGALLAAANAFVGLKVGMTISASIPAAVVALLVMRKVLHGGTLLESNMVQTVGSAGECVAAGMIFTLPALFIMGSSPAYLEMVLWGAIGGLLGVCFMVPLRQVLIVKEHGTLPFPEGVACAEVLQSGERGGTGAKSVIAGAVVGGVYYLFALLGVWKETGRVSLARFRTEAQLDASPALLGVGYILGVRVAAYMLGGALLSWFIVIPAIGFFGAGAEQPVFPETTAPIASMTPDDIYESYVRYIGAGAVAIGGLISLFKSFGTIGASLWHVIVGVFTFGRGKRARTERDFPFPLLVLIIAGLGYAMWHFDEIGLNSVGVIAVLVFSFFFVTVSARLVGIVGSSSNPISGMTIATLLGTALVFKFFVLDKAGEMADADLLALKLTCLSVGAIVCIALSIAGDTSQDLKTGFLVKATPYKQQGGEMIGVLTSVVAIAGLLLLLNNTHGFVETPDHPHPLPAYQANIMKILVDGVLGGQVPWTLIMIGGAAAVIVEMLGLPALPFAVGMYLPLGLSTPIMVGGLIRWLIDRRKKSQTEHDPGVLTASGLVAGQGLIGVALAGITAFISWWWSSPRWANPLEGGVEEPVSPAHLGPWIMARFDAVPEKWGLGDAWWDALPMLPFIPLAIWLWWCARRQPPITLPSEGDVAVVPVVPVVPTLPPEPPPDAETDDGPPADGAMLDRDQYEASEPVEPEESDESSRPSEADEPSADGTAGTFDEGGDAPYAWQVRKPGHVDANEPAADGTFAAGVTATEEEHALGEDSAIESHEPTEAEPASPNEDLSDEEKWGRPTIAEVPTTDGDAEADAEPAAPVEQDAGMEESAPTVTVGDSSAEPAPPSDEQEDAYPPPDDMKDHRDGSDISLKPDDQEPPSNSQSSESLDSAEAESFETTDDDDRRDTEELLAPMDDGSPAPPSVLHKLPEIPTLPPRSEDRSDNVAPEPQPEAPDQGMFRLHPPTDSLSPYEETPTPEDENGCINDPEDTPSSPPNGPAGLDDDEETGAEDHDDRRPGEGPY